ncbi:MAG: hypothetical protein ACF8QF_11805 [Phycisphaerales bacterium]
MNGRICGATALERAVALAGALAEAGVTTLEFDGETLAARDTDLPGRLLTAGAGTLRDASRGFEAHFGPESCRWRASDPELGARLADISGS